MRCEVLGEPRDKEAVTELENRLLNEEEQLEKLEHEAQQQAEQVRYMEDYWKKLEQTHEIREKTLQWLDSLAGGTQMFLDEAVGTYVKAFVLSVTIFHRNILESTGLMTPVRKWSVTAYLRAISSPA